MMFFELGAIFVEEEPQFARLLVLLVEGVIE